MQSEFQKVRSRKDKSVPEEMQSKKGKYFPPDVTLIPLEGFDMLCANGRQTSS